MLALTTFLAPALASAAVSIGVVFSNGPGGTGLGSLANTIINLINGVLVPLLFSVAFIVFLYGVFKKYIWSRGDEAEVEAGHKLILWGLLGFVVMISVWGLVNVVATSFGLTGYSAPCPPSSIPGVNGC